MKKIMISFLFLLSLGLTDLHADSASPDLKTLIQNAEDAFYQKANRKRTDFWVARYLGLSSGRPESGFGIKNIEPFLHKRKLTPKAFFPDDWDPEFIDWFQNSIHARWAVEDNKIREKHRSFEIAENLFEGKYFVKIVAYPEIEMWHLVHEGIIKRTVWMAMGSYSDKPTIFFGKKLPGMKGSLQATSIELNTERRSLHYVWQPEFYDLDEDGTPEVWIRFNLGWGNGFAQVLDIYKIKNETELVLIKRFKAQPEGMVRRSPDGKIELATAHASHDHLSRMQYDLHHMEVWEFKDGNFKRSSEKDIPFIYRAPSWKDYL
jgi:hypothetical protein